MKTKNCRLCNHPLSESILKFPPTPLANECLDIKKTQDLFPLEICCCDECGHYQLNETVDPERLFKHYLFVAGTSPINVEHFRKYAVHCIEKFNIKPGSLIVDIASNDGTMLKHFKDLGMRVLGIDPAVNIAEEATRNGIPTLPEFFTEELAESILLEFGEIALVTANNVFAHTDLLNEFTRGVKTLIGNNGVFSFEVSYFKDVIDNLLFDTIYHEHTSYHMVTPLSSFFNKNDMILFDVERIDTHGGSLRGFVSNRVSQRKIENSIYSFTSEENKSKLQSIIPSIRQEPIDNFYNRIMSLKDKLVNKIEEIKKEGKKIAIFGFPAKATTLMYTFGITNEMIDFAIDDSPLKQDRFTPGTQIPIYSSKAIIEQNPDYIIVMAWNFANSIIAKHPEFKGTWIVPLPDYYLHN